MDGIDCMVVLQISCGYPYQQADETFRYRFEVAIEEAAGATQQQRREP